MVIERNKPTDKHKKKSKNELKHCHLRDVNPVTQHFLYLHSYFQLSDEVGKPRR